MGLKVKDRDGLQKLLDGKLAKLKARFGLAGHLHVVWDPKFSFEETHGLVKGSTIFIFDIDEKEALHTLKHEFIEYILTHEFLSPKLFEAKSHRRADALVDIIANIL